MTYLLLIIKLFCQEPEFNYQELACIIAEKESQFQCQVVDPYNITYGRYQVTPHLIQKMGYYIPRTCEQQDEMIYKLFDLYEDILKIEEWEFKTVHGIFLHKTNLLIAMHFAPYGTLRYLKYGVDFSNGLISVSGLLRRYEKTNLYSSEGILNIDILKF